MDVWLHVGAGKTGTSAIQAALAQGRDRLDAAGLFYPEAFNPVGDAIARAGGITSGNGLALGWLVGPRQQAPAYDEQAIRAWLLRALEAAGERPILFSSEFLQQPLPAALPPVLDLLCQGGRRRVRVLHFSRHALDYAVAGYAQQLKTAQADPGEHSLEDRLAIAQVPFLQQLNSWAEAVGRDAVVSRLYDEDRHALVRTVLACVHPPAADVLPEATEQALLNRSPTPSEMRLLQALNAEPDAGVLCRPFVRTVLNAPAAVPETLTLSESAVAIFAANNTPILDAINRDWLEPAGRAPIRLSAGTIRVGDVPPDDAARIEAVFAACYIATVRMLEEERLALRREVRLAERADAAPARGVARPSPDPVRGPIRSARAHALNGRIAEALSVLDAMPAAQQADPRVQALRERFRQRRIRKGGAED